MKTSFLALALGMIGVAADAATVASGYTAAGDIGGFDAETTTSYGKSSAAWTTPAMSPNAQWVWADNGADPTDAYWYFTFDLTGYDVSTAAVSGQWMVDNFATVSLNGNLFASLTGLVTANFTSINSYGTSNTSFFNTGLNTLYFIATDAGGDFGFRANVTVTADVGSSTSAVPLPAAAPLLLLGLGGLAALRRRKG